MSINSYSEVCQLGHKMIEGLLSGPVVVEEKVDGSQFSFGLIDGELLVRSKNKQMIIDAPEKMFNLAIATVKEIAPLLHPGWTYRAEFLGKPKHNTLVYERVPKHNIIGFDVMTENAEEYLTPAEKRAEFDRLGLECVPCYFEGMITSMEVFADWINRPSILGGKIEGVVIKNYALFTAEKKVAMGKYVREDFKEVHAVEWRKSNPTAGDIVDQLIERYRTPTRWQKAVQHLRENGQLTETPADIGALMREVPADVLKECQDEIMAILFKHFWPKVQRGIVAGVPEWYKGELTNKALGD